MCANFVKRRNTRSMKESEENNVLFWNHYGSNTSNFVMEYMILPLVKRRMQDDCQLNQELRRYKRVVITQRQTGSWVLIIKRQCIYNNNSNVRKRLKIFRNKYCNWRKQWMTKNSTVDATRYVLILWNNVYSWGSMSLVVNIYICFLNFYSRLSWKKAIN